MPQLDTTTWFNVIVTALITLFIILQTIISKYEFPLEPLTKLHNNQTQPNPWELKWTKIYLPHLSLQP
nr:ATP synthase F0 subunit 8 [Petrosaltator rozeti]